MLHHKNKNQSGFTITELTVVIVVSFIATTIIYTIFNTSFLQYLGLQQDSFAFDNLTRSSQRIASVFRSITDINEADDENITFYSYFSPNDTYVSLVNYYVAGPKPSLYADVTPMTANPPNGTPIVASKKTFTIIEDFYSQANTKTFVYLDAAGNTLAMPITDLHTIKGIKINLAIKITSPKSNDVRTTSLNVSLRNRKTNL